MRELREWLKNGEHLPAPLRDFHDQKDVFKSMHEWIGERPTGSYQGATISWIDGQCYTIDHFLRFMAAHGWTLQRSRKPVAFVSLDDTIKARREKEREQFQSSLSSSSPTGGRR